MSEIILSQSEADTLLAMKKIGNNKNMKTFLPKDSKFEISLISEDKKEEFVLNYTRGSINLEKRNHNFRVRKFIGLARLDLNGPPHRNPDGQKIDKNHLHLYREGYNLKWAYEIPEDKFIDIDSNKQTLIDFMKYCNIDYDLNAQFQKELF